MSAQASRPGQKPDDLEQPLSSRPAPDPDPPGAPHLDAESIFLLVEGNVSRRKLRASEAHLDECAECAETLAMVLRTERPASREEQHALASTPEPTTETLLDTLRPRIGAKRQKNEWMAILGAFVVAGLVALLAFFAYQHYWLPAASRRLAQDTLTALVELRQATGRVSLRYITEFERAGVVRSGFDTTDAAEQALLFNLRSAVERAPEPDAVSMLGLLLLDAGELDEAESLLNQVLESNPRSVDALNGLAVVYFEKARSSPNDAYALQQKGLGILRQAEGFAPTDLRVLYNFGKFYEALGMSGAARKAWARYLENDQVSQWAEEAANQLAR